MSLAVPGSWGQVAVPTVGTEGQVPSLSSMLSVSRSPTTATAATCPWVCKGQKDPETNARKLGMSLSRCDLKHEMSLEDSVQSTWSCPQAGPSGARR